MRIFGAACREETLERSFYAKTLEKWGSQDQSHHETAAAKSHPLQTLQPLLRCEKLFGGYVHQCFFPSCDLLSAKISAKTGLGCCGTLSAAITDRTSLFRSRRVIS
jgi:hypothetical protein